MSREATLTPCPKCGTETIKTNWDPIEHMPTPRTWRADPTAITPEIEAICIITDRPTYGHYTRGNTNELALREVNWHRYRYRGTPKHVFPAHQCGQPLPGTHINLTTPAPKEPDPDEPFPF